MRKLPLAYACDRQWADMQGRGPVVRHCGDCGCDVVNLSALDKATASELLQQQTAPVRVNFRHRGGKIRFAKTRRTAMAAAAVLLRTSTARFRPFLSFAARPLTLRAMNLAATMILVILLACAAAACQRSPTTPAGAADLGVPAMSPDQAVSPDAASSDAPPPPDGGAAAFDLGPGGCPPPGPGPQVLDVPDGGRQYTQTFVVNAVPGDPLASGTALWQQVISAGGATSTSPVLVKVGAGQFDLGENPLGMRANVDVEGAGPDATIVVGKLDQTVLHTVVLATSELRALRIRVDNPQSNYESVVYNSGSYPALRDVTVEMQGVTRPVSAVANMGGGMILDSLNIIATTQGKTTFTGLSLEASAIVTNSRIQVNCADDSLCVGVGASFGTVSFRSSSVDVSGTGAANYAFHATSANLALDGVTAAAESGYGLFDQDSTGTQLLGISCSALTGPTGSLSLATSSQATGFIVDITGSILTGPRIRGSGPISLHCVDDYDGHHVPIDAMCD